MASICLGLNVLIEMETKTQIQKIYMKQLIEYDGKIT